MLCTPLRADCKERDALICWLMTALRVVWAKGVGARRLAIVGTTFGTNVGMFFGIVGGLIARLGAVVVELIAKGRIDHTARVGFCKRPGMAPAHAEDLQSYAQRQSPAQAQQLQCADEILE
jgi:hypothetical protein